MEGPPYIKTFTQFSNTSVANLTNQTIGLSTQYAKIGNFFSSFIPKGVFADSNNDALTYSSTLAIADKTGSSNLPTWLQFNGVSAAFSGTPSDSDFGVVLVNVTASDNIAGNITGITVIRVDHLPQVNYGLTDQVAGVGIPFVYAIPKNTITHRDGYLLTYTVQTQNSTTLPLWLNFNTATLTFAGTPAERDIWKFQIQLYATDPYKGSVSTAFVMTVEHFPQFNRSKTISNQVAGVNYLFSMTLDSSMFYDLDGNSLTLQVTALNSAGVSSLLPGWLVYDTNAKRLYGTPGNSDRGNLTIVVTAVDPLGGTGSTTFNVIIENFPVVANPLPSSVLAGVNYDFTYTIPLNTFIQPDGGTLMYSVSSVPSWLHWNLKTLTLSGTPPSSAAWQTYNVVVQVQDRLNATVPTTLSIFVDIFPEVIAAIPTQVAGVGEAFSYTISVDTYFNGTYLSYFASNLPNWLSYQSTTQTLKGTPASTDIGSYQITITATDYYFATVDATFTVMVEVVPTVSAGVAPSSLIAAVNQGFSYTIPANTFVGANGEPLTTLSVSKVPFSDVKLPNPTSSVTHGLTFLPTKARAMEPSALTYSLSQSNGQPLPAWLTFNPTTNTLSGQPSANDFGQFSIMISVKDSLNVTRSITVSFTVDAFPYVTNPIPNQIVPVGADWSYQVPPTTFGDNDQNDVLTYSLNNVQPGKPSWLQWQSAIATFKGTPSVSDKGTLNVTVGVVDSYGGTAQTSFNMTIVVYPGASVISLSTDVRVLHPFTYSIPVTQFTCADQCNMTYALFNGTAYFNLSTITNTTSKPASWLTLTGASSAAPIVSGNPPQSTVGDNFFTLFVRRLDDPTINTSIPLTITVIDNQKPIVTNPISNQVSTEGQKFKFVVPRNTFTDPNSMGFPYI